MTVRLGMKYTEVDESDAASVFADDTKVLEQKMDGTQVITVLGGYKQQPGAVRFFQSGGKELTHAAAVQKLPALREVFGRIMAGTPGEMVLAGELLIRTGEYYLFDVPYLRLGGAELIRPTDAFARRRKLLDNLSLREHLDGSPVEVIQQARTQREKRALFEAVRDAGGEGVVAKDLGGAYEAGKRVKHTVKIKLVKSCDVVVTRVERPDAKHGHFEFGVVAPGAVPIDAPGYVGVAGQLVQVLGRCSAIGKAEAKVGDVIEVAYLYREPETGGLVQPRMMRVREDKSPAACTLAQFPAYSRGAVCFNTF